MQDRYIKNENIDINLKDYIQELDKILKLESEEISVLSAIDRITYEAVFANLSSPFYNCAAMDGIAVLSERTRDANDTSPLELYEGVDFEYINTGNPIKDQYDSVIMIEEVISEESHIKIIKPSYAWQHIRLVGEDIAAGEMILPSNHSIRPVDLGALLSGGVQNIKVYKKPKVGIIPTGSELVEDIAHLSVGKIMESNSRVFEGLIIQNGGIPNRYPCCKDDYKDLYDAVSKGVLENDILLINAGSSAGSKDFTAKVIRELGQVHTHGFAMKPGKPAIIGFIHNKPIIGIPGYPVSSFIVYEVLVKPLIQRYLGLKLSFLEVIKKAKLTRRIVSSLKNTEYVRVTLGFVRDTIVATPLMRGAGSTMSLVKADGLLVIDKNREGLEAGESVDVRLIRPIDHIYNTLVSIGSHDIVMDIISDMMNLSSAHTGSMGGIVALTKNECHIAPIHLLDEESGEYNISYVKKFFEKRKMVLIKGVRRLQGIMVQKGNKKGIHDFSDLAQKEVKFINRQRGSGTRLLLDYNLKRLNIDSRGINGFDREVTTHMAVATLVSSGTVDCGIGVLSAAKVSELDFVEVGYEDYDFLTSYEDYEKGVLEEFIKLLKDNCFQNRVRAIGGYDFVNTGDVLTIGHGQAQQL